VNDSEFLSAFEACTLPPTDFMHRGHIRMAWLTLRRDGWERGVASIRDGIQRYAAAQGATQKYHETITMFWARLVQQHIDAAPELDRFADFAAAFPELLNSRLIAEHYSRDLLATEGARHGWVAPDLVPMR
jgi:hypothetical protein